MTEPKNIKHLKQIELVYEVTYEDGSTGLIKVHPFKLRPIVNGEMCTICDGGERHCLYLKLSAPSSECPILTIQEE